MSTLKGTTYHQGHHPAVTANHVIRTSEVEGAFLLTHLSPDDHVLDIGCGPGSITTGFAKYVPKGSVTGIDLTEDVIQQARAHLSSQNPKPNNVIFQVGNVLEGLPYEDDKFDVVYCNQVLIHIPDPVSAMKEMKRVCKPGGLVACREGDWPFRFVPYPRGLQLFNKYLYELVFGSTGVEHPDNAPHQGGHRGGSLVHAWAREAGFEADRIEKRGSLQTWSTPGERRSWADIMIGRIEKAGHGEKFMESGASREDVDLIVKDLGHWRDDVDGWLGIVQCEVISRA